MKRTITFTALCLAICVTTLAAIPTKEGCTVAYVNCTDSAIEEESEWEMYWDLYHCSRGYKQCLKAATRYE